MKKNLIIITGLILMSLLGNGLEIKSNQINKKVTIFRAISEPGYSQNTTVIQTPKGLIIIDTGFPLNVAKQLKEAIVKKLGRNDFKYLINTHGHMDHSIGNQLYKNAIKIAHLKANDEMIKNVKQWDKKFFVNDFQITYPDINFEKYLKLTVGNLVLHLYYPGSSHTDNHILIHIPKHNVLSVGDCFHSKFPPFVGKGMDLAGMIKTLDQIIPQITQKTKIIPGHRNVFSGSYIKSSLNYYKELQRGIKSAFKQKLSMEKTIKILIKKISRKGLEKVAHWDSKKNVDSIFKKNIEQAWKNYKKF